MKKLISLVLSLALMSLTLIGCQSKDASPSQSNGEIIKVSVSKSNGFGKVNPGFFIVFEDKPALNTFEGVITNAVKNEGIVDIMEPKFDFEVVYSNGNKQGFHLWLDKKEKKAL